MKNFITTTIATNREDEVLDTSEWVMYREPKYTYPPYSASPSNNNNICTTIEAFVSDPAQQRSGVWTYIFKYNDFCLSQRDYRGQKVQDLVYLADVYFKEDSKNNNKGKNK